jgi:hypothetical protein
MTDQEIDLRQLDAWIAEHVFDFAWVPRNQGPGTCWLAPKEEWKNYLPAYITRGIYQPEGVYDRRVPKYSTDPAASFEGLRKILNDRGPAGIKLFRTDKLVTAYCDDYQIQAAHAPTLEQAICLLAKKLYAQRGEGE